jgi:tetratricopeptide (TPR) repeat protein
VSIVDVVKKLFSASCASKIGQTLGLMSVSVALSAIIGQPAYALFYGTNQQAEAYKHEADAYVESGNYDQAINYYTQAINMLPSDAVQGRADTFYNRAIANDVAGHFDSATQDWTWSRDYYLRAAQYSYGSDAAESGVNIGYDKQLGDQLGNLVRWRATVNPYSADYEGDAGPIKLWDLRKMPLKVFIDDSQGTGWSPDLRELIWQAVNSWSGIAGIPIRFQTWNSADGAHYIITRPANAGQIAIGSGGYTSGINDTPLANGQQMLAQSKSLLSSPGYDGNSYGQIDKNKLYNLALHECGHALGLGGHSPSGLDIMYWKAPILRLSSRDQATMRRMYPSR